MMNVMLVNCFTPNNISAEVLLCACHIQNRISCKKIRKTPYKL